MTTTTITPEMQEAVVMLVRQELEQQLEMRRANQNMYRIICRDFEEEMNRYDRHTLVTYTRSYDGTTYTAQEINVWGCKIRDAVGTLLRAIYNVKRAAGLPASAEPEMRKFIRGVLDLMEQCRPPESPAEGGT